MATYGSVSAGRGRPIVRRLDIRRAVTATNASSIRTSASVTAAARLERLGSAFGHRSGHCEVRRGSAVSAENVVKKARLDRPCAPAA